MIKLSKLTDYGVVVLSQLALQPDVLHTASGVARQTGLPEPTVAKIMKALSKGGMISSVRGVNGGYKLVHDPEEISMAQVITALDGPIALASCTDKSEESCAHEALCPIKGRWNILNNAMVDALESVSLADMNKVG